MQSPTISPFGSRSWLGWVVCAAIALVAFVPLLHSRLGITTPSEAAEYFPLTKRWFLGLWLLLVAGLFFVIRRYSTRIVVAAIVLFIVAMVVVPPLGSGDAYSSVVRSVSVEIGDNPFTTLPHGPLVQEWLPGTWRNYPTPYGPLWHSVPGWLFVISGHNILHAVMLLRFLGCLVFVALIVVARLWLPVQAWRSLLPVVPLASYEIINNVHPDGLMVLFLLVSVVLAKGGKFSSSSMAWILAVAVKPVAVLGLGILSLVPEKKRVWWLATALVSGGLVIWPYLLRGGVTDGLQALSTFSESQTLTPVTALLQPMLQSVGGLTMNQAQNLLGWLAAMTMLFFVTIYWRRVDAIVRIFGPFALVLAMVPILFQPWYLLWIVPLVLMMNTTTRALVVMAFVLGHAVMYITYSTTGGAFVMTGICLLGFGLRQNRHEEEVATFLRRDRVEA